MTGLDLTRVGYIPPGGGGWVTLAKRRKPELGPPPTVSLSATSTGKVSTVTATVVGSNANTAGITWQAAPGIDTTYSATKMTGPQAVFKHATAAGTKTTITCTVPRTDGGPPVTASLLVLHSTGWKSGVFPRAWSWGEDVKVEDTFGFVDARSGVTARLVRTASPGAPTERTVIETRTVDFPASTPVVLTRTMSHTRPAGKGGGYEYRWEVDAAPSMRLVSQPLPVWVYGLGTSPQPLSAAPSTIDYPAVYCRAAIDSRSVTPAAGLTYTDHLNDFLGQWKATNLGSPVGGAWLSFNEYNSSIYWVNLDDATIPRYTFKQWDVWEWGYTKAGWYGSDPWAKPWPRQNVATNIPVPDNATPSPGTDRSLAIVGMRGGKVECIWEMWLAEKMGDGSWRAASIGYTTAADEWRHSEGYTVAASGISAVAYSLKVKEAKAAVDYVRAERAAGRVPVEAEIVKRVPHALAINMPNPRSGRVSYPATFSDGANSNPAAMWEGQLAYIRSTADIDAQNYPPLTHVIAVVGKHRGFRCTDKTSWSTSLIVEGDQSYGGGMWKDILTGSESWAVKFPDSWFVVGKQYATKADFDADTTVPSTGEPLTVTAVEDVAGQVLVTWTPVVSASVSRDGVDTDGSGPWTDTATGSYRFLKLRPGDTYTFTVSAGGKTATAKVTMKAAPAGVALPANTTFNAFTASNGAKATYHLWSSGRKQGDPLLVWLHGDAAYEHRNPTSTYVFGGTNGVVNACQARGIVCASALSPDTSGTVTWWESASTNVTYLSELLNKLAGDIKPSKIILAGFSGGAQFITQYFVPQKSAQLGVGGSIVFGGGGKPVSPSNPSFTTAFKGSWWMNWTNGALDDAAHSDEGYDALAYAKAGASWYANAGFRTSTNWVPNTTHVMDGRFGGWVAGVLDANK